MADVGTKMSDLVKGLKAVRNNLQAQTVIVEALSEVRRAQRTGEIPTDLRNSERDLQTLAAFLNNNANRTDFAQLFAARKNVIVKAYVNVSGATGAFSARRAVSLVDELKRSGKDVGEGLAVGVKTVAGAVGDTAGSVLGGVLKGLGPVVIALVALGVWFKFFKKGRR